jgi:16S rRNA processing protein RimM
VSGVVAAPFGLKGFVKVHPFSGNGAHLLRLRQVVLRTAAGERSWEVEEAALIPSYVLLKFKGIGTPEAAKELGGAELLVGRQDAAPLACNEYYVEDLKGMDVVLAASPSARAAPVGKIVDVIEGGGGQLAEIELVSGVPRLVPFRNEFFGEVNIAENRIVLLDAWVLE